MPSNPIRTPILRTTTGRRSGPGTGQAWRLWLHPQRDSNPCRHLERAGKIVLSVTIVLGPAVLVNRIRSGSLRLLTGADNASRPESVADRLADQADTSVPASSRLVALRWTRLASSVTSSSRATSSWISPADAPVAKFSLVARSVRLAPTRDLERFGRDDNLTVDWR
jgi:hypothetical protein